MERVIKFRGKLKSNGEYIYGDLLHWAYKCGRMSIMPEDADFYSMTVYEVIPETVSQFTGLYDSKGVEIYEGDVCRLDCYPHWNQIMCVGWHKETAHFGFRIRGESYIGCNDAFSDWIREKRITVIGNIYDNPDWEERK